MRSNLREKFPPLGAINEHGTLRGNEISRVPAALPAALQRLKLSKLSSVVTKQRDNKSLFLYAVYRKGNHAVVSAWQPDVSEAFPHIFQCFYSFRDVFTAWGLGLHGGAGQDDRLVVLLVLPVVKAFLLSTERNFLFLVELGKQICKLGLLLPKDSYCAGLYNKARLALLPLAVKRGL